MVHLAKLAVGIRDIAHLREVQAMRITAVAKEATGVYWMALYSQLMEAGLEVTPKACKCK